MLAFCSRILCILERRMAESAVEEIGEEEEEEGEEVEEVITGFEMRSPLRVAPLPSVILENRLGLGKEPISIWSAMILHSLLALPLRELAEVKPCSLGVLLLRLLRVVRPTPPLKADACLSISRSNRNSMVLADPISSLFSPNASNLFASILSLWLSWTMSDWMGLSKLSDKTFTLATVCLE